MSELDPESLGRIRTVDLTTTGRRSGRPVRIEIWWFRFEDRFIVTGTPGPRHWLANLRADPALTVHVDGQDLPATAAFVVDRDFRHRFFTDPETSWYADQVELDRLVEEAPMVELTFTTIS